MMPRTPLVSAFPGKVLFAALLCAAVCFLLACSPDGQQSQSGDSGAQAGGSKGHGEGSKHPQLQSELVVGLFVANSGLGDRGFMDSIYQGALAAKQEHNTDLLMEQQPKNASPQEEAEILGRLADRGCDLVICSSSSMQQAMHIAAKEHLHVAFVLLDGLAHEYLPNVSSATFASEQAAFLAGALAARMSQSKVLSVIGGNRQPAVKDFILGFEAGARHVLPDVEVSKVYIEDHDPDTLVWNNPEAGRKLAARLHQQHGADIHFPVAGASGIGVINYVSSQDLYAIGIYTDQDYIAQGRILTSVIKRLDVAVQHMVDRFVSGRLRNRNYRFTLADGGVGLSEMRYTREAIPEEVHQMLSELGTGIISGRILVPAATVHSGSL